MYNFLITYSYIGTFLLMLIENLFPPIPSEVILLFSGFLVNKLSLNIVLMILVASLGALLGAIILYFIGDKIKFKNLDKAQEFFSKYGIKTVFLGRFIPIFRSVISIPAGMFKINFRLFLIYTFLGSIIWNSVLIFLGYILNDNWYKFTYILKKYDLIIIFLVLIFIMVNFFKKQKKS